MWLLDVNLPSGLVSVLKQFGIEADTTSARGWRDMDNGPLARAAFEAGFGVILTRDRLFGRAAEKALQSYPKLAVVVIRLTQSRQTIHLEEFKKQWKKNPIGPIAGSILEWPEERFRS